MNTSKLTAAELEYLLQDNGLADINAADPWQIVEFMYYRRYSREWYDLIRRLTDGTEAYQSR